MTGGSGISRLRSQCDFSKDKKSEHYYQAGRALANHWENVKISLVWRCGQTCSFCFLFGELAHGLVIIICQLFVTCSHHHICCQPRPVSSLYSSSPISFSAPQAYRIYSWLPHLCPYKPKKCVEMGNDNNTENKETPKKNPEHPTISPIRRPIYKLSFRQLHTFLPNTIFNPCHQIHPRLA